MELYQKQQKSVREDIERTILTGKSKYERANQVSLLTVGGLLGIIGGLHLAIDDLRVQIRGRQIRFPTDKIIGWSANLISLIAIGSSFLARHQARKSEKELRKIEDWEAKKFEAPTEEQHESQTPVNGHVSRLLEQRNTCRDGKEFESSYTL